MIVHSPPIPERDPGCHLTLKLAEKSSSISFASLPEEIVELSTQCLLDWLGVTIAGAREPVARIVFEQIRDEGGNPQSTIIVHDIKASMQQAALVNGTASHALDYDDVNWSLEGHPSAAIIPGLLALAEHRCASGGEFITAFVAGYETACRIGRLVSPSHYKNGFHNTATIGAFGAAAACARLLGLDVQATAIALSIAGTQAAGLKSMFGTMCKPLHAGMASQNGLLAATLAARGFESRADVLECEQGFAATQSTDFNLEAALSDPPEGYYLRGNLFKYHAACYLTHSVIESCLEAKRVNNIDPEDVSRVLIWVDETLDGVCNIKEPKTGNEAKFSLRMMAAFALAGIDTSSTQSYSVANCTDSRVIELRDKVTVQFIGMPATRASVQIDYADWLADGHLRVAGDDHDSGIPVRDLAVQRRKLEAKFRALVDPILGAGKGQSLIDKVRNLPGSLNLSEILSQSNLES